MPVSVVRIEEKAYCRCGGLRKVTIPDGTEEIVLVYQGELEIVLVEKADERYAVPAGSVISYRADQPHIYRNLADGVTRAAMVINYAPPKKAP